MRKFGKVFKKKFKRLMVAKELHMGKIFKKFGLNLMFLVKMVNFTLSSF